MNTGPATERAGALLTIDLAAVRANWQLMRGMSGGSACAAVVKADAYGLGAGQVARALAAEGCRTFFVAHLDEAITLRSHLAESEIFVLHGCMAADPEEFSRHAVVPVLNGIE